MFPPRQQQDYERFFKSRETTGTGGTFPEICIWKSAVLSVKRSDCYWKDSLYISSVHEVRFIHHHKAIGLRSLEHLKQLPLPMCINCSDGAHVLSLNPTNSQRLILGRHQDPQYQSRKAEFFYKLSILLYANFKVSVFKNVRYICLLDYQYMSIQKPCAMQA